MDLDGSGTVEYTGLYLILISFSDLKEFLAATVTQKQYLKEERLYTAFRVFD